MAKIKSIIAILASIAIISVALGLVFIKSNKELPEVRPSILCYDLEITQRHYIENGESGQGYLQFSKEAGWDGELGFLGETGYLLIKLDTDKPIVNAVASETELIDYAGNKFLLSNNIVLSNYNELICPYYAVEIVEGGYAPIYNGVADNGWEMFISYIKSIELKLG